MARRSYTVEWLSESSHRNTTSTNGTLPPTLPHVDLLIDRLDQALPYGREHLNISSPSGMQRPTSGTSFNEKENHVVNQIALYQAPSTLQDSHGVSTSRRAFQEALAQRPSPVQNCQLLDSGHMTSPGSTSEEEATSRPRTKFTAEQLQELEKSFSDHRYIGSSEKKRLSQVLKLSETQIKTWFQNRRMKFKRQSQDARVEAFFSGRHFPHYNYLDFQQPSCSVQPDLAMPLAPPVPVHPYGALQAPVTMPALHAAPIPPLSLGSYPYPPVLVHPMFNDAIGHIYNPY